MIQITERHMVGGRSHEHIAEVKWRDISTNNVGKSSRNDIVVWLDAGTGNKAVVGNYPSDFAYVGVVRPEHMPAYIRTYADAKWTDDLLTLPEY